VPEPLAGLDVSHFQKTVDWPRVAAAGKVFSYIKASEGALTPDAFFEANRRQASKSKIIVGAYHLFHPGKPVADQVTLFVGKVGTIEPGELPPVLDLEVPDEWKAIAKADRIKLVLAWLQQVEQKLSVRPIIYAGPDFVESILGSDLQLAKYRLWLADYALQPDFPDPWSDWTFWQFTDRGAVDGITGHVDLDTFNGSRDDLNALLVKAAPATILTSAAAPVPRMRAAGTPTHRRKKAAPKRKPAPRLKRRASRRRTKHR
jgi:lysozyme